MLAFTSFKKKRKINGKCRSSIIYLNDIIKKFYSIRARHIIWNIILKRKKLIQKYQSKKKGIYFSNYHVSRREK